jgi:hypothetical protein
MAYQWCSTLFEVVGRFDRSEENSLIALLTSMGITMGQVDHLFPEVGRYCDRFRSGDTSHHSMQLHTDGIDCLFRILAIVFREVDPRPGELALCLDHISRGDQTFETIFSSDDDETIADAVCIWIGDYSGIPPGSLARYLTRRVERAKPLSPRLRRVIMRAMKCIGRSKLEGSGLEIICLLNHLQAASGNLHMC